MPTKRAPTKRASKSTPPKAKPARTKRAASSADPFAGLWSLDGSLAEAVRAQKVRITPAVYAAASMDTMLFEDGGSVRVEDGARVYATSKGQDVATMRLSGDTLIVRFIAPKKSDELARAKKHYRAVAGKPGWIEFRRPATRDPRPEIDADLGSVLGQASFERK